MNHRMKTAGRRLALAVLAAALGFGAAGCPRNQTTLDDRTLEQKPHVETTHPTDRSDPFRP